MDRDADIRAMVTELSQRFPTLPVPTVERLVRRLFDRFADAPVQTYVPVLVRREAESALHRVDPLPAREQRARSQAQQPA